MNNRITIILSLIFLFSYKAFSQINTESDSLLWRSFHIINAEDIPVHIKESNKAVSFLCLLTFGYKNKVKNVEFYRADNDSIAALISNRVLKIDFRKYKPLQKLLVLFMLKNIHGDGNAKVDLNPQDIFSIMGAYNAHQKRTYIVPLLAPVIIPYYFPEGQKVY